MVSLWLITPFIPAMRSPFQAKHINDGIIWLWRIYQRDVNVMSDMLNISADMFVSYLLLDKRYYRVC
jgi:hypothetical protein